MSVYIKYVLRIDRPDQKPLYRNFIAYNTSDVYREVDRLMNLDLMQPYKELATTIDAKGRKMKLVQLGYNSKYVGQYSVRFYTDRWQMVGRYTNYKDAHRKFIQRWHKIR